MLMKFGNHLPGCPRWVSYGAEQVCTCGFHDALGCACPNCILYSPREKLIERVIKNGGMTREEAEEFVDRFEEFNW